jgi:hypothetical protein
MAENGHNGHGQAPSTTLVLTITLDQLSGALNVNGPIQNALLCYGMLEAAKDAIRNSASQGERRIVPASMGPRVVS